MFLSVSEFLHIDAVDEHFGLGEDSPRQRVQRVIRVFPDEVSRVNVADGAGDAHEMVDPARFEEGLLQVEQQSGRRTVVAVQSQVKVSPVQYSEIS